MAQTDMVNYYAQRAAEYERVYEKPERQQDIQHLRQICASAFSDLDVLEISCGTGYWTAAIEANARSVLACDINEEALAIARSKSWPTTVAFRQADSYALPDFGRHFSGAFASFWWSHIPKKRLTEFLCGLHRHLEPGAFVMFIDNRYVEGSSTPLSRIDADGDSFQHRQLDDGSAHEVLKNFPSKEELISAVTAIADSVEVTLLDYYWILSYRTPRRA